MFAQYIDKAASRILCTLGGRAAALREFPPELSGDSRRDTELDGAGPVSASAFDGQGTDEDMASSPADLPILVSNQPRDLVSAEPDLQRQNAGILRRRGRVRWLELRNKIAAYRLFNRFATSRRGLGVDVIGELHAHSRLFATEGYAYRYARPDTRVRDMPLQLGPIALHAGTGIRLAEQALAAMAAGKCEESTLAAFYVTCRSNSLAGFSGVTEEALGLVARMLYPEWIDTIDKHLRTMDSDTRARFWHGAGRGIYFAPSNAPPSRACPWKGVARCLAEPGDQAGKRNALSGFSFALTLVNLRRPEVLESFCQHHARQIECMDGAKAAMAVWMISGNEDRRAQFLAALCRWPQIARALRPVTDQWHVAHKDRRGPERLFSARDRTLTEDY